MASPRSHVVVSRSKTTHEVWEVDDSVGSTYTYSNLLATSKDKDEAQRIRGFYEGLHANV